ncbi:acid phosphatase [Aquabacter spiritensis]|uniref:Acid phosphatase n=1 Tax=Aquabacter spiritensis TaxID=933073 RepID=A0A4R3M3P1_9HYPH|nr:phosphatase PAP2 family protein [Aquabacter spiritensis]TCT07820.1 acid phosphatase (class A) [Aquabacter spiritensis]
MFVRATALAFILLTAAFGTASAQGTAYLRPDQADLTRFLAPAPTRDSQTTQEDVRILLDLQAVRTPETIARANADVDRVLTRFSDAVGTDLSTARAPRANAFVDKAAREASVIVQNAKAHWGRLRPFLAFPDIHLVVPKEDTGSYPSGHATWGMMTAILLANMVPEKAVALYERGAAFGFSRLIGGVHYPSDVEAGRLTGTALAAIMMNDAAFRTDLAAAAEEVRGLLGLAPLASVPAPAATSPAPEPVAAK